jgi:hypothetical protein
MVINGVTRVDDRIGAQGYGHRAYSNARLGSRKFSYSHGVSWTPKTKILGGSELSCSKRNGNDSVYCAGKEKERPN